MSYNSYNTLYQSEVLRKTPILKLDVIYFKILFTVISLIKYFLFKVKDIHCILLGIC